MLDRVACCPTCGRSNLNATDIAIVDALRNASEPMTVAQILDRRNVSTSSWRVLMHRLNKRLAPVGYRVVNVAGNGPWPGRYRLEPLRNVKEAA